MNIYLMKKPKRVNSVSVSVALLVLVLGYAGWFFLPAYWPVFQLNGIMHGICNDAYRIQDETVLMQRLLKEARRTGLKLSEKNFRFIRVQWTDEELRERLQEDKNAWALYQRRGKECVLQMRYVDRYPLPLLGNTVQMSWSNEVKAPMEPITWEKKCTCVSVPAS